MGRTTALPALVSPPSDGVAVSHVVDVGALYALHAPFLLRVVERLTGSGAHVEDLVQEVFIVAHRRRAELRDGDEVRGWLYRVTANLARQHKRSLWRRFRLSRAFEHEPLGAPPRPDELADRRERAASVRRAVLDLPFVHREAFVLVELEGLDARSTAALLGVPEGTVSSRLSTARRLFKERWQRTSHDGGAP